MSTETGTSTWCWGVTRWLNSRQGVLIPRGSKQKACSFYEIHTNEGYPTDSFLLLASQRMGPKNGYVILSGRVTDLETKAPLEGANVLFRVCRLEQKQIPRADFPSRFPPEPTKLLCVVWVINSN